MGTCRTGRSLARAAWLLLSFVALIGVLVFGTPVPASAQRFESTPPSRWHLSTRFSAIGYNGDGDAQRVGQRGVGWALSAEVMHPFNNVASMGLGAHWLRHPRLDEPDQVRSTVQALLRFSQPPGRRSSPYLQVGAHGTTGIGRNGFGPVLGMGLNFRLSPSLSFYQEASFNVVFPGDVLDSHEASPFDVLAFFGAGFRITDLAGFFGKRRRFAASNPPKRVPSPALAEPPNSVAGRPTQPDSLRRGSGHTLDPQRLEERLAEEARLLNEAQRLFAAQVAHSDSATPSRPVSPFTETEAPAPQPSARARLSVQPTNPLSETGTAVQEEPPAAASAEDSTENTPLLHPESPLVVLTAAPDPQPPGGRYTWVLETLYTRQAALQRAMDYTRDGYPSVVRLMVASGRNQYLVTFGGYASLAVAEATRSKLPSDARPSARLMELDG